MKNPLTLLLPCLGLLAITALATPRIACDAPIFDFGNRDSSTTVAHTFIVKNTGSTVLKISRVKPACGCTVVDFKATDVPPGGSTEIKASLNLKGRTGPQTKPMTVYSNDPGKATMQLTLRGSAVQEVDVSPSAISFGRISQGDVVTKTVAIVNNGSRPLKITRIESANRSMNTRVTTVREGFEYKVEITNPPTMPPGRISDTVIIHTDNPKVPTSRVTVYGTVLDKLTISPNPLVLPETGAGIKLDRTIYVRQGSVKNFQVIAASWKGSDATVTIKNHGVRGFTVHLSGFPATRELNGTENILRTDVEGFGEVRIPVTVRPQSPLLK